MATKVGYGAEQLAALREMFSGEVLEPGDEGFEQARRVHNGLIDRRPALIARCREHRGHRRLRFGSRARQDLGICIRGGGHNVAGRAVVDDALMIDLSPMKGIYVDPDAQTVRAQGGVLWRELNARPQRTDWRSRAARSRRRGSPASRSAAGSAG